MVRPVVRTPPLVCRSVTVSSGSVGTVAPYAAPMSGRRRILLPLGLVLLLGIAFGLYWFTPWKLFIDRHVNETLPSVAFETVPAATAAATPAPAATSTPAGAASSAPAVPQLLSRGTLISHEHTTSGTVSIVRRADGSRILAIAHLKTSDGPDVHVWLSDAPVIPGEKGWYVFGRSRHVDLGSLKGNIGNQYYVVPAKADLARFPSVTIWCQRFDVSFGAAELTAVAGSPSS